MLHTLIDYLTTRGAWVMAFFFAVSGRVLYHTEMVKKGRRRFWSWRLLLELPTAVGMGVIAYGGCALVNITGDGQAAIIAVASYLGPHGVNELWALWLERKRSEPSKSE